MLLHHDVTYKTVPAYLLLDEKKSANFLKISFYFLSPFPFYLRLMVDLNLTDKLGGFLI